jgi:hypothetical protein
MGLAFKPQKNFVIVLEEKVGYKVGRAIIVKHSEPAVIPMELVLTL